MTSGPCATIIIGTLNRCEIIENCLRSLLAQETDGRPFEILVVDNGCTDRTEEIVARLARQAPTIRYVKEPRLGLSNARNCGIAHARGPLLAFFDDDATAEPGWLKALLDAFGAEPEIAAAGGPIEVRWPVERPRWMPKSCEGYYGHCDYGPSRRYLGPPEYPYGSNMMLRRDVLVRAGGFHNALGAKGASMMAAEELELFGRLYDLGYKVLYEPAARVQHWPQAERVQRAWLLRRAFRHGMSSALVGRHTRSSADAHTVHSPGAALSRCVAGCMSASLAWLTFARPHIVMSRAVHALYWAGLFRGLASRSDHARSVT